MLARSENLIAATATLWAMSRRSASETSAPSSASRMRGGICLGDQLVQLENAALARLVGFAVLAVHGAEAQVLQPALGQVAGHVARPQDLLEVQRLALVDD